MGARRGRRRRRGRCQLLARPRQAPTVAAAALLVAFAVPMVQAVVAPVAAAAALLVASAVPMVQAAAAPVVAQAMLTDFAQTTSEIPRDEQWAGRAVEGATAWRAAA